MNHRKKYLLYLIALLVLLSVSIVRAYRIPKSVEKAYEKEREMEFLDHLQRKEKKQEDLGKQQRKTVVKHLYFGDKKPRPQVLFEGKKSELAFMKKSAQSEVKETFEEVSGIIQEELFYKDIEGNEYAFDKEGTLKAKNEKGKEQNLSKLTPCQRFRTFQAERAVYDYHKGILLAYTVFFWTYEKEGHELIRDVSDLSCKMKGEAESMILRQGKERSKMECAAENLHIEVS